MKVLLSNSSKEPIYQQIIDQIILQILNGTLKEDDALPSMRSLARDLKVSVITSKRAYEELEKAGYIYSIVGKGSFVAKQIEKTRIDKSNYLIRREFIRVVRESKSSHVLRGDLIKIIDSIYGEE
ncbi:MULTISPECIES: GntR family transcriptional regulator [Bacillus]|jgi:GntR family transcriptional regulator|uniref:GntR family transcriptional regulator n=4 Tax=Bacillus cereus group TaxID=86661 RepID=A0AAW9J6J3_BACTU|nr:MULTISPECIES: GntR family transcriptional regulator [Bacillus]EEM38715.1 Transcriptional regulator, GntR [Bacillus thuringiensis serovar sotto str. T04001]MCT6901893.1 GntR family transcriptional regulator [Lactobacillus sp.]PGK35875.1 GntR family transcriptional regulator [Bacillus anthracis]AFQ17625.1 GntR family transcriptional regulator [Bacillus thuringiensis HD-771]ASK17519.1 GntR family transcriptional regulator [Bacillus cereus]